MGGSSSLGTSLSRSSHHPHSAHPKLINPKSGSHISISLRRRIFAVVDSVSSSRSKGNKDRGVTGGEESEWESQGRAICTTPGMACAGETETETETDEPASSFFPTVCLFSSNLTMGLVTTLVANGTFPKSRFPPIDLVLLVGK